MPRGTTLANLRLHLRAELGQTMDPAVASQGDARFNQLIQNKLVFFCGEYDWPFLKREWNADVPATTRWSAFPTTTVNGEAGVTINHDRPVKVEVKFGFRYLPVEYGIGTHEYNVRNPENGEYVDPIQKWQVMDTTAVQKFEVWPVPLTLQTVKFTAQRNPVALCTAGVGTDAAICDLDDMLLVWAVAFDELSRIESPEAAMKGKMAAERLAKLRASYKTDDAPIILGRNNYKTRRQVKLVAIR